MTKILVVDDEANVQRLLQYTLKQAGYSVIVAGDGNEAVRLWQSEAPSLILLDIGLPKLDGYGVAEKIRADEAARSGQPHVPIIMLTSDKEVEQKVRGLRAGADDYLVKPFHQAELLARMKGLLSRYGGTEAGALAKPRLGRMIAFYGAKGGVGGTTIAINTAIALARNHDRKVVLVDGALQLGDHRVFLDMGNDRKSIIDAVAAPNVDSELLKSVLISHESGVDLLLAPATPEESDLISEDRMAMVLQTLRAMYDYVIVDVDKRLGDLTLSILDHADELHVVMTADLSCLKNVRLVLDALHRIGFQADRLRMILNRSNAFTGISPGAAESALKRKFEAQVENDYRIAITAQNTGMPFVMSKPDSPLGRQISTLAKQIDGGAQPLAIAAGAAPKRGRR